MIKSRRFAVILAGCGNKDGAEIQESVLTLLAIDKAGHTYQCFAPDVSQVRTLNFLTNEPLKEQRNVLVESARIARSNIKPLSEYKPEDFDILILPGGSGVAYNLCTYATQKMDMSINDEVTKAILSTYNLSHPIGALCIAPVMIAKLIPKANITIGQDVKPQDIVIDTTHKIVTTPCYMVEAKISEIAIGIEKCVLSLVDLT